MLHRHMNSRSTSEAVVLHRLTRDCGLRRYGLFCVTQEGRRLPDGSEDASGYVLDESGRTFYFWLGWAPQHHSLAFTEWEQVEPDPAWPDSSEYQPARVEAGLA
jgi:hypothetical protein